MKDQRFFVCVCGCLDRCVGRGVVLWWETGGHKPFPSSLLVLQFKHIHSSKYRVAPSGTKVLCCALEESGEFSGGLSTGDGLGEAEEARVPLLG